MPAKGSSRFLMGTGVDGPDSARSGLRAYIASFGWLLVDRAGRVAVGALVGIIVARALGPWDYGQLSLALALVMLAAAAGRIGLEVTLVRELVDVTPAAQARIMTTAFRLRFLGALLAAGAAVAAAWFFWDDQTLFLLVLLLSLGQIPLAADVVEQLAQARVATRGIAVARGAVMWSAAGARLAVVLLAPAHLQLLLIALVMTAESVCTGLALWVLWARDRLRRWRAGFCRRQARELFARSWPMLLSSIAIMIYMRIDQIMLGAFLDPAEVGRYSVAVRLSELWYFVPVALVGAVFPAIVRARADAAVYRARLQGLFSLLLWMAAVVALGMTLLGTPVIHLAFGEDYLPAGPILAVHAWAGIFVALGVARDAWCVNERRTVFTLWCTLAGAAINVGCNLLLIPAWGGLGAAWATVCAQAVTAHLANLFFAPARPLWLQQIRALWPGSAAPALRQIWRRMRSVEEHQEGNGGA